LFCIRCFCRAMLCKRGLYRHAVSVRPSVCHTQKQPASNQQHVATHLQLQEKRLSVTFVDSVKTNKYIFKKFSTSGSQTILVFHTECHGDMPTRIPLTGASNAGGVGKNRDLSQSGSIACCVRLERQVQHIQVQRTMAN